MKQVPIAPKFKKEGPIKNLCCCADLSVNKFTTSWRNMCVIQCPIFWYADARSGNMNVYTDYHGGIGTCVNYQAPNCQVPGSFELHSANYHGSQIHS
jgi:hypothetical protein